jgi:hypothetical protein
LSAAGFDLAVRCPDVEAADPTTWKTPGVAVSVVVETCAWDTFGASQGSRSTA